jgi:DNA-binding response OmpR family regulator
MANILSIGPDHKILAARNRKLRAAGHRVRDAETRKLAIEAARNETFDLMLLCDQFLPAYAAQLADELGSAAPGTTILILAGRADPLSLAEIDTLLSNRAGRSRAA